MYAIQNNSLFLGLSKLVNESTSPPHSIMATADSAVVLLELDVQVD